MVLWFGAGGLLGYRLWHEHSYVGRSTATVLRWRCLNSIVYEDTSRNRRWRASYRSATGLVETGERVMSAAEFGEPHSATPLVRVHEAKGRIYFDTRRTATFRSTAGGTLMLEREEPFVVHTDECIGSRQPLGGP
jgi:hypothetical protein